MRAAPATVAERLRALAGAELVLDLLCAAAFPLLRQPFRQSVDPTRQRSGGHGEERQTPRGVPPLHGVLGDAEVVSDAAETARDNRHVGPGPVGGSSR